MSSLKPHLHAANVMLFAFVLTANAASAVYALRRADSASFDLLRRAGLLYAVGYWLVRDARLRRADVPYCPGVFVVATAFLFLPYYLYKTRGSDAFGLMALFLVFYVGAGLLGALIAAVAFGA